MGVSTLMFFICACVGSLVYVSSDDEEKKQVKESIVKIFKTIKRPLKAIYDKFKGIGEFHMIDKVKDPFDDDEEFVEFNEDSGIYESDRTLNVDVKWD